MSVCSIPKWFVLYPGMGYYRLESRIATAKLKGKSPTAKQDIVVLSVSTGSQNSATGLSTGSLEKGAEKGEIGRDFS